MFYDRGLSTVDIVRRFMDGEDRIVASVVGELAIDKYEITVKRFKSSMTTLSSWLVNNIPHTLLILADRRLEVRVQELRRQIAKTSDTKEQMELLKEQTEVQRLQKQIKEKVNKRD